MKIVGRRSFHGTCVSCDVVLEFDREEVVGPVNEVPMRVNCPVCERVVCLTRVVTVEREIGEEVPRV